MDALEFEKFSCWEATVDFCQALWPYGNELQILHTVPGHNSIELHWPAYRGMSTQPHQQRMSLLEIEPTQLDCK